MADKELTLFFVSCLLRASIKVDKSRAACKSWHSRNRNQQQTYRHEYRHGEGRPKWLASSRKTDEARRRCGNKISHHAAYLRDFRITSPNYALAEGMRNRINQALKSNYKTTGTSELLGCSISEFKKHLESLFLPGMSWANRGVAWHVDHIKPCASFDLADPVQQRRCFHYTNLQPLWALDNLRKGAKWPSP